MYENDGSPPLQLAHFANDPRLDGSVPEMVSIEAKGTRGKNSNRGKVKRVKIFCTPDAFAP